MRFDLSLFSLMSRRARLKRPSAAPVPLLRARADRRAYAISFTRAAGVVRGHGYMTEPPSRQYEAYKANGWPNQVAEYDPHGVAAGGMYADCDGCRSRDWFGPNPWSEPGSAKHLDFVMGGTGGNILGVCGASPSRAVHESMSRRSRSSLG